MVPWWLWAAPASCILRGTEKQHVGQLDHGQQSLGEFWLRVRLLWPAVVFTCWTQGSSWLLLRAQAAGWEWDFLTELRSARSAGDSAWKGGFPAGRKRPVEASHPVSHMGLLPAAGEDPRLG